MRYDATLDCAGAMRLLFDYLDEELTPERMAAVQQHLALCAHCYPHYEFEKAFLEALANAQLEEAVPERVRQRVLSALREAGFTG